MGESISLISSSLFIGRNIQVACSMYVSQSDQARGSGGKCSNKNSIDLSTLSSEPNGNDAERRAISNEIGVERQSSSSEDGSKSAPA